MAARAVLTVRCSAAIAMKLGAFKAAMEGPAAFIRFDCMAMLIAGDVWLWPIELGLEDEVFSWQPQKRLLPPRENA